MNISVEDEVKKNYIKEKIINHFNWFTHSEVQITSLNNKNLVVFMKIPGIGIHGVKKLEDICRESLIPDKGKTLKNFRLEGIKPHSAWSGEPMYDGFIFTFSFEISQ